MDYIEIKGKEYPVAYSLSAILWFADFLGVSTAEAGEIMDSGMTERKGMALMYSGLVAGAEKERKRLDISFSEFQELLLMDSAEWSDKLGTLFQRQFEVTVTKLTESVKSKKKSEGSPLTLKTSS